MAISIDANQARNQAQAPVLTASFGALGIVYGDIGTSPLYALKETIKVAAQGGPVQHEAVLGSVSHPDLTS